MDGDRSHEILNTVLQRRHLFHTAVLSLSAGDRETLIDKLAEQLKKKAVDISGFVQLGGWPQVETFCAGDHLCVILAETRSLPRSSSEAIESLFKERVAGGGPWQQLAFSLSAAGGPPAARWLAQRIKGDAVRDRFMNEIGVLALDELYRGEHLSLVALSREPILPSKV